MRKTKDTIVNLITNIATKLTCGLTFKKIAMSIFAILIVCIVLIVLMLGKIPTKIAFFVDDMTLNLQSVTVGQNSDLCVKGVPQDYLTIHKTSKGFDWTVNPAYKDTLQYFKINDKNPNRIEIKNDGSQKIRIYIPSTKDGVPLQLTLKGSDIWEEWGCFSDQEDVMLRHFAVHYESNHNTGYAERDTLGYTQQKAVRSFLQHKDDRIVLVVLDELTSVDGVSYARSGNVEGDRCKVQFFSLSDYCYADNGTDNSFRLDGVNYSMKSSVKLTEWGAGHLMLSKLDGGLHIAFPKALGYVETLDTLRSLSNSSGGQITLKQSRFSSPSLSSIYLPQLSSQASTDICTLIFNDGNVTVRGTKRDSMVLESHEHWVPTLQKRKLDFGNGTLGCRIGIIDRSFICSYLWIPGLVAFVLLFVVIGPFSRLRVHENVHLRIANMAQLRAYPLFMGLLIFIAFCYCVCKSMIALKLSYSYPYFEKMTGIIPISTSLTLLLFFTIAVVLNTNLVRVVAGQKYDKPSFPFTLVGVIVVIFAALIYAFFYVLDEAVNVGTVQSYFPTQVNLSMKFWNWNKEFGINDTHRSVVYSLIGIEGFLLMGWCVMQVWYLPINIVKSGFNKVSDIMNKSNAYLVRKWNMWMIIYETKVKSFGIPIEKPEWKCIDPTQRLEIRDRIGRFVGRLPLAFFMLAVALMMWIVLDLPALFYIAIGVSILIACWKTTYISFVAAVNTLASWHTILLVALIVVGKMAGNFGTAFITLGVIFGLCNALSSVKFEIL